MNRENILSALFSRVSGAAAFATASRRLVLWSSVAATDKPALFMVERADMYVRVSEATPECITMQVELYIYTDAGLDQTLVPATTLNTLLDAIDTALQADPMSGRQTLGNLVSHCWIEGKVLKDAGDMDGNGVAVVPIKILVPR